jgi:hypothetical protein
MKQLLKKCKGHRYDIYLDNLLAVIMAMIIYLLLLQGLHTINPYTGTVTLLIHLQM